MNKQGPDGIGWCDYTWNPIGGCRHGCRWEMPDGTLVKCYAESVAEGVASAAYPEGFQAHYWHPDRLDEPAKVKHPSRIFLDSMSDIMGHWVPDDQIIDVLEAVAHSHQHTFQLLTKNAPRLEKFKDVFPDNLWVGVSMPPTFMNGARLSMEKQRYIIRALDVLETLHDLGTVTWMSFEPLSFDVGADLDDWYWDHDEVYVPLDWAVIGAASNGRNYYQPEKEHVNRLMNALRTNDGFIPVFMKGNLEWRPRREEFPTAKSLQQLAMF